MKRRYGYIWLSGILLALALLNPLAALAQEAGETPTEAAAPTEPATTATAATTVAPTATSAPTAPTAAPTNTVAPAAATEDPTATIAPTDTTMAPTHTTAPSAATEEPTTATPTATTPAPTNTVPAATATPLGDFTVSTVEPRHISTVSGGVLTVLGTGFTSQTTVRLEGFGLLDVEYLNSGSLRATVPSGVKPDDYRVRVTRLEDGAEVRFEKKVEIDKAPVDPTATPYPTDTPLPTAEPTAAPGRPQLVVSAVRTDPTNLAAGEPFTLTLDLANRGNRSVATGRLNVTSDAVLPVGGGSAVVVGPVRIDQTISVTMSLIITGAVDSGYQGATVGLEYTDYEGDSYTNDEQIWLEVSEASTGLEPRVILQAYHTVPDALAPGDTFILTLEVVNVGGRIAQDVNLTLGGASGSALKPFALLDSGNVVYLAALAAGQREPVDLALVLDGTSDSGVYSLPVEISYGSGSATRTETQVLNLVVQRRPQLQIGFYRDVGTGMVDQPIDLPLEIVNLGRNLLNVGMVEITSYQMDVQQGSLFMGPLEGGTSGSMDAVGIPSEPGDLDLLVTVSYLDDFNQPQEVTQTITVSVEAMPEMPDMNSGGEYPIGDEPETPLGVVWRVIRGLLGLGS